MIVKKYFKKQKSREYKIVKVNEETYDKIGNFLNSLNNMRKEVEDNNLIYYMQVGKIKFKSDRKTILVSRNIQYSQNRERNEYVLNKLEELLV